MLNFENFYISHVFHRNSKTIQKICPAVSITRATISQNQKKNSIENLPFFKYLWKVFDGNTAIILLSLKNLEFADSQERFD